jgi:hypothetical protein
MDRKHAIFTILTAIPLAAIVSCANTGKSHSAAPPTRVAASSASAVSPAHSCKSQVASWSNGGLSTIGAVYTDLSKLLIAGRSLSSDLSSGANPSAGESSIRTAAATVQADVQAADADLPPSCVPHYRKDLHSALTDIANAASQYRDAASDVSKGARVASKDISAAGRTENAAATKLAAAIADYKAFKQG